MPESQKQAKMDLSWIGGAAGGLLSSISSAISANKQLKAQKEENALNRQFNADEAQKSRDFELDMFNRTNSYNDPKQVVDRLSKAGLNPALAFGGFQNAAFGGNSAAAFSNNGVGTPLPDFTGMSSAGQSYLNARLIESQARKNDADADKTRTEIPWVDKLAQLGIDVGNQQIKVDAAQEREINKRIDVMSDSQKEIRARVKLIDQQTDYFIKENTFYELKQTTSIMKDVATIQDIFSSAHLKDVEAYRLSFLLNSEKNFLDAGTNERNSQAAKNHSDIEVNEHLKNNLDSQTALNNSKTDLNNFQNALNDEKLRQYGLSHLSKQQVEAIEESISKMKADTRSTYAHILIDGLDTYSHLLQAQASLVGALLPW